MIVRKIKNWTPPTFMFGSLAIYSYAQKVQQTAWWMDIPWLYFGVFFTGMTAWELLDSNSDVRKWLRGKIAVFVIEYFIPASTDPSTGLDAVQPTIKIRFLKKASSPIILSVDTIYMGKYKRAFCQEIVPTSTYDKGTEKTLVLATINMNPPNSSRWEAIKHNNDKHPLSGRNLATIRIGKQSHKFYIEKFEGGGCRGVCYIQLEGDDIWNEKT